jgi:hypothetical protein
LKTEKFSPEMVAQGRALAVFVLAVVASHEASGATGKPNVFGFSVLPLVSGGVNRVRPGQI